MPNAKSQLADIPARRTGRPWGTSVAIDAAGCNPGRLRDEATVSGFLIALVDAIGMKAYGGPEVVEFGEGGLHGLSAKQWIYTSSITWHAGGDGAPDEAYLDIFTCGDIEPRVAAELHNAWFGGTATIRAVVRRGSAA
jgi:S-adenosylmethionine/arginine decarboxylase-like enzyme